MDKNYVHVGNIIEQERVRRQAQISKGIVSDVYDHIEKAHNDDLNDHIEKSDNLTKFETDIQDLNKAETELLLHKIQRQLNADSESTLLKAMKSIAINHYNDIEKAKSGVYADTAENRKLGRVGQQYGGKKDDGSKSKGKTAKQVYDEDFNDDLKYFLDSFGVFGAPKEAGGVKVGTVNNKGEIWVPSHNQSKDGGVEGRWMSKKEIEDRVNNQRSYKGDSKLTSEQKKAWPIGAKYTDKKGREFTITKHDTNKGRIKLSHKTDDGKKKVVFLSGYNLKTGLHPNITTGFPEIDKILRKKYGVKKAEENDIEKAGHGIYEDNAENRRLNRVGQEYGHAAEQKEPINRQPKKQEEGGGIQSHAAKASDEALRRAAADEKAKPEVREAAKKELTNRGGNKKSSENSGDNKGDAALGNKVAKQIIDEAKNFYAHNGDYYGYDSLKDYIDSNDWADDVNTDEFEDGMEAMQHVTKSLKKELANKGESGDDKSKNNNGSVGEDDVKSFLSQKLGTDNVNDELISKVTKVVNKHIADAKKTETINKLNENSADAKKARRQKSYKLKEIFEYGTNKDDSIFMSENESYFKDVLKKHGFESFDDFEEWGARGADNDWDKYEKIFKTCFNKIPAEKFLN